MHVAESNNAYHLTQPKRQEHIDTISRYCHQSVFVALSIGSGLVTSDRCLW